MDSQPLEGVDCRNARPAQPEPNYAVQDDRSEAQMPLSQQTIPYSKHEMCCGAEADRSNQPEKPQSSNITREHVGMQPAIIDGAHRDDFWSLKPNAEEELAKDARVVDTFEPIQVTNSSKPDASSERTRRAKNKPDAHLKIPACIWREEGASLSHLCSSAFGRDEEAIFETDPPVTVAKLKELSLPSIQNNLPLRNDLCYDPELFFQRISGTKGEEKLAKAKIAYTCLLIELRIYAHDLRGTCKECEKIFRSEPRIVDYHLPSRLEHWLRCIRDLVAMLVPEAEKEDVKRAIDAENIAMTVRIGQSEVAKLSSWLAKLLMSHCAPIRDDLCKSMHCQISKAAETRDMNLMVDGLESLFNLLENMKLDVANHQIRTFKTLLITDTVPFLQDCFGKMMAKQEMVVEQAKIWYDNIAYCPCPTSPDQGLLRLLSGMVKLCTSPHEYFPATFRYDKDRLINIRTDIVDLVELSICVQAYVSELNKHLSLKTADLWAAASEFRSRVIILIHNEDGGNEGIPRHLEDIAYEMVAGIQKKALQFNVQTSVATPDADHMYTELDRSLRNKGFEDRYTKTMCGVKEKITEMAFQYARCFARLDTLQISNEQRNWSLQRPSDGLPTTPTMEDIARRLSHVAVVHWQTWAELAYLKE